MLIASKSLTVAVPKGFLFLAPSSLSAMANNFIRVKIEHIFMSIVLLSSFFIVKNVERFLIFFLNNLILSAPCCGGIRSPAKFAELSKKGFNYS